MFHGDSGLDGVFAKNPIFERDTSKSSSFVIERVAIARGSLILDQPFFGYLLGHFEIIPVKAGMNSFAADTNHLYFNTQYFNDLIHSSENWKAKIKGILIHLLIHIIFRHHKRQKDKIPQIWGYACDIVVFNHLFEMKNSWNGPSDWEIPNLSHIDDKLRNNSAEKTYSLILEIIKEQQEESEQGRGADSRGDQEELRENENLEEYILQQKGPIQERIGMLGNSCDISEVIDLSQHNENEDLEEQYFEGILQSAYERQKGFGSLPEGLDRWVNLRLAVKINWKAKLTKYLQSIILHDLTWTRPNTRMYNQGYYFPGPLKNNTEVILGVDTSGSIEDDILSIFLSEAQSILETITNVKLIVIDCDAEIQQIKEYEAGETIFNHTFKGKGGTDFRPVFDLEKQYQPDVIIYITDGYGKFPLSVPHTPVIWVLTTDEIPPFGEIVRIDI